MQAPPLDVPTAPVPQQPELQELQWMPMPLITLDCPPGLEYLTQVDQLLIHQQVELFEGKHS